MLFSLSIVTNTSSQNPVNPPPLPLGQTQLECVTNLTINKFTRHPSDNWKVVVSGPDDMTQKEIIKYEASTPNKDPFNKYNWILGNEVPGPKGFINYWSVTPLSDSFKLKGQAFIPYNKLPLLNDDFGTTHGDLTARENDIKPGAIQKDVKVFFRKDDINYNDDKLPNWFFYWSQLYENELDVECIKLYDPTSNTFKPSDNLKIFLKYWDKGPFKWPPKVNSSGGLSSTYGECHIASSIPFLAKSSPSWIFYPAGPSKFGLLGPKNDGIRYCCSALPPTAERYIVIGQSCGYYFVSKTGPTDPEGIEVLSETFFHELEHYKIMYENWKDGYDTDLDSDLDGYNDEWEVEIAKSSDYKFDKNVNDSYQIKYSAGYNYEESRCRTIQKNYTKIFNQVDWSFDPTNKIQGKQWK